MKKELDYIIWSTSCIRFVQSKRFKKTENTLFFLLLMLSFYLSAITLAEFNTTISKSSEVGFFISIASLLITLFVVLLKSANYSDRANLQHECGRKTKRLLFDLKLVDEKHSKQLQEVSDKYNNIIDSYENHSKIDYLYFWYENFSKVAQEKQSEAPNAFLRKFVAPLCFTIAPFFIYIIAIFVPPIFYFLYI